MDTMRQSTYLVVTAITSIAMVSSLTALWWVRPQTQ